MEKMEKKIQENFLTSSIFTFSSYTCFCTQVMVLTDISSGTEPALKIVTDQNHPLHFAFGSKVGLVRLNEDGSIAESNILGKLVAIKKNNIKAYISFFEKNGFLFPLDTDKPYTICLTDLQIIVDRLHATLELISTITDMSRTSYEKIVRMIFYHLFAPTVSIETKNGGYKYSSGKHKYAAFLEKYKDSPREERLNDTFNNTNFMFSDSINRSFVLNADFVDSVLNGTTQDNRFETPIFQNVFTIYCSAREDKPKPMLIINDFVCHYLYEVGVISNVDLESTNYVNDFVIKENFSNQLKARAIEIAKNIIKEEIESNLCRVRPTYDVSKLEPSWKIDSLLSALYFGLFYMRPNMEIYRRCANPKCGQFFLVSVSSRKKKYCCTACMNRDMIARKRARDKLKATMNQ